MFFALGFLTAGLLALIAFPAVNARAERLARRRIEAQFPLSITELTAEKDHLRAEFAVLQRRLERKAEEALAEKHDSMEELGRRAVRVEALETELGAQSETLARREAELAEARTRLVEAENGLASTNSSFAGMRDTLAAVEAAHRQTLDELETTRARLENAVTELAQARTELAATKERLAMIEAAHAELDGRNREALGEVDAKRITVSDLETRLATQKARADEFERMALERRSELGAERQRLADIARSLVAEQERSNTLEQRLQALEAERAAGAAAVQKANAEIQAENADLRRRIDEVADDILRFAKASEGRPEAAVPAAKAS
jgi:chromosome segregation ATPase